MTQIETIKLVRHGLSEANKGVVKPEEIGDANVKLAPEGIEQARSAGAAIGASFLKASLFYRSPWARTRETADNLLIGAGLLPTEIRVYEDPRLREVESGYSDVASQEEQRRLHGFFWYRFHGGESPADTYSTVSTFLESYMRQVERKKSKTGVIVTHGRTIRVFVMRFLHLSPEDFNLMANPENGDVITIGHTSALEKPVFIRGRWGVEGIKLRDLRD